MVEATPDWVSPAVEAGPDQNAKENAEAAEQKLVDELAGLQRLRVRQVPQRRSLGIGGQCRGPSATPQRPIVLASGILPPPTWVKSQYTRLARTSRSNSS